jgi:hypothetical protein
LRRPIRLLYWTPRFICLLFAVFVSLFALDVPDDGLGVWGTLLVLLIHFIPTAVVLVVLAVAWRREWVGGVLFVVLGVWYLITASGRFGLSAYFAISGPLFLIGLLFLLNWVYRDRIRREVDPEASDSSSGP